MDEQLFEQAARLIARGGDVERLLIGQWSPAAVALRALGAVARALIEAADEAETRIHDAAVQARADAADDALDAIRWECRNPECPRPTTDLELADIAWNCGCCNKPLTRVLKS